MIRIEMTGEQASGKSLLLRRIQRLLRDELGVEMRIDDDRTDGGHFGLVTLDEDDRKLLGTTQTVDEIDPEASFFVMRSTEHHVGEVVEKFGASITVPTLAQLRELESTGALDTILTAAMGKLDE